MHHMYIFFINLHDSTILIIFYVIFLDLTLCSLEGVHRQVQECIACVFMAKELKKVSMFFCFNYSSTMLMKTHEGMEVQLHQS
jgi:hypothetical protein